jgi:hypothetical protein
VGDRPGLAHPGLGGGPGQRPAQQRRPDPAAALPGQDVAAAERLGAVAGEHRHAAHRLHHRDPGHLPVELGHPQVAGRVGRRVGHGDGAAQVELVGQGGQLARVGGA